MVQNQKNQLFFAAIKPLLVDYIQVYKNNQGYSPSVNNVVMMKLFYFFVLYGNYFHVVPNWWAYSKGPVDEDSYLYLLKHPGYLYEQYNEALQESQKGISEVVKEYFASGSVMNVEDVLKKMRRILTEDERGLIELSHESGAWLEAYVKRTGIKSRINIQRLKAERDFLMKVA